jgi:hypothetical protein
MLNMELKDGLILAGLGVVISMLGFMFKLLVTATKSTIILQTWSDTHEKQDEKRFDDVKHTLDRVEDRLNDQRSTT